MRRKEIALIFAATGTTKSGNIIATTIDAALKEYSKLYRLIMKIPDYTNTITTTLQLLDEDNHELWTSPAEAQNATYQYLMGDYPVPIGPGFTVKATISGVAGTGGGTVSVVLYYD